MTATRPKKRTAASPPGGPQRVKMSVLSRMSGVPMATIKHYVLEGLLPEPERTGRNMAYYDVALVEQVRRIKELQRTRYLPLKVIRSILDHEGRESADDTVAASIARALARERKGDRRTRVELERSGMPREQLDWLVERRLVRPRRVGGREVFDGDDLELLRILGAARAAGLEPEMLPVEVLASYAAALEALVRVELRLFREGVVPRAGSRLSELTEAATELSERLVVLLRRKLLLPTLETIVGDEERRQRARPQNR